MQFRLAYHVDVPLVHFMLTLGKSKAFLVSEMLVVQLSDKLSPVYRPILAASYFYTVLFDWLSEGLISYRFGSRLFSVTDISQFHLGTDNFYLEQSSQTINHSTLRLPCDMAGYHKFPLPCDSQINYVDKKYTLYNHFYLTG